ncbi:MAG: triose-phosphate isomerase family protein [Patescibacteria group bacterium]
MSALPFYIVGNWKSNKTVAEAVLWWQEFSALWRKSPPDISHIKVILCPAFIHLQLLDSLIKLTTIPLHLGLQDVSGFPGGAYTGQVSAQMAKDMAHFTLVGHSERRKYVKETDVELGAKVNQAVAFGIEPIYCVQSEEMTIPSNCQTVAYEPVWAIGTGTPDTPQNARKVAGAIKASHSEVKTVIYGGSVTAQNVAAYVEESQIGGVLPGGASLTPLSFYQLILNAAS